jgi:hypothetical protein
MIKFDTIKLQVPPHVVTRYNGDAFMETIRTDKATGHAEIFEQAKNQALPPGVSSVKYKEGEGYQITMSAKTLGQDYLQGISINNWQRSFETLAPILEIDTHELWQANPKILSCDATDNISIENIGTHAEICEAMLSAITNKRFLPIYYNTRKNIAFEFRGTQQEKNRIIGYAKHLDLLKPANKNFMKSLPNSNAMYEEASKMIRFETNHTTFKAMRQRFNADQNNLQNMLQSKAPVNHNFLLKVIKGGYEQGSIFEELKNYEGDFKKFIMIKGIENIIQTLNYEQASIIAFFKRGYENRERFNKAYYKSKYPIKKMIEELRSKNEFQQAKPNTIVTKCLDALLQAVA